MTTGILRMIICFGMALMLIVLLVSGDITLLINPRFRLLILISILLLIGLGIIQALYLKQKPMHRVGFWGYVAILFPITVYLFVPPQALDASMIDKKGMTLVSSNQATNESKSNPQTNNPPSNEEPDTEKPFGDTLEKLKKQSTIVFDEENYSDYLTVLELYPNELKGKKIQIKGFVFRDEVERGKDEFILSRFTVSCCTADASVVGVITKYPQAPTLQADRWIEVKGTLSTTELYGFDAPLIELESYQSTSQPKDPYIYFQ